jgi:hypothetical protein
MYQKNGKYVFSPSDLMYFMNSPFSLWMDRFSKEYPNSLSDRDAENELSGVLQQKIHQQEATLEATFIAQGYSVTKVAEIPHKQQKAVTLQDARGHECYCTGSTISQI